MRRKPCSMRNARHETQRAFPYRGLRHSFSCAHRAAERAATNGTAGRTTPPPDAYFDEALEYAAIRNACAVFDLTPMTKHRITGPDALPFLNRLVTRDVAKIKPGKVGYCVWCDDNGQVIDDGTIFHLREGDYRLCSQERQLDWLSRSAHGFDVSIVEDTHDVAALALQGPTSCAVLKAIGCQRRRAAGAVRDRLLPVRRHRADGLAHRFHGRPRLRAVDRAGARARSVGRIVRQGREPRHQADGNACAGSRTHRSRLHPGARRLPARRSGDPPRPHALAVRARPRALVDLTKPHFNGRRALLEEQKRGSRYRFVRLDIEGNKPARSSYIYDRPRNGNVIGTVTSARVVAFGEGEHRARLAAHAVGSAGR